MRSIQTRLLSFIRIKEKRQTKSGFGILKGSTFSQNVLPFTMTLFDPF